MKKAKAKAAKSTKATGKLALGGAGRKRRPRSALGRKRLENARMKPVGVVQMMKLVDLSLDDRCQPREQINGDVVADYAEVYADPERRGRMPPPIAFRETRGLDKPTFVGDGFHRCLGAQKAGLQEIEVEVRPGGLRDAILLSVGANASHGLRRSNPDKRRAVTTLLEDQEWAKWSNAEIARLCHVSAPFVAGLRPVTQNVSSEEGRTYTDKHGNTSTMKTGKIGKAKSAAPDPGRPVPPGEPRVEDFEQIEEAAPPAAKPTHRAAGGGDSGALEVDDAGTPLPANVMEAFGCRGVFKALAVELDRFLQTCKELHANHPRAGAHLHLPSIEVHCDNLKRAVVPRQPSHVCGYCHGQGGECRTCLGTGFVYKDIYRAPLAK